MLERPITIKEVARKAGVGIATVSRVLNNSERVDSATRARVQAVIRRLGYRPNAQGRRLVKRAADMVCFVLCNRHFVNPFHSGILWGAQRFLGAAGRDVVFASLDYSPDTAPAELTLPHILTYRGIADGVILSGTLHANLLTAMEDLRIPCVLFGNNIIGEDPADVSPRASDAVYYDDGTARQLAERLIGLGHRAIWFAGNERLPWFRRRLELYRAVLRERALVPLEFTEANGGDPRDYGVSYGERATERILESGRPVTALVAGNDGIAYGVWRALQRRGIRVPADVSLVGFDDVQEARLTEPPLTTARVPTEQIGRECADMLLRKLEAGGESMPSRLVPTVLVERGSCAPPPLRAAGTGQ
jgi:DNA-binding LacI/PurR family transcriptional regulator